MKQIKDFKVTKRKKHNLDDEYFVLQFDNDEPKKLSPQQARLLIETLDKQVNCFEKL